MTTERGGSREEPPRFLVVGQVVRPHGVRGELKVRVLSDDPDRLRSLKEVWVNGVARRLLQARPAQGEYLVLIEGFADRNAAERLRGAELSIPVDQAPELGEGEYYLYQIIGLWVVATDGRELGVIEEVMETGSNDVLVVRSPDGREVLVPAIDGVVETVDLEAGLVTVIPIPGLLEGGL